MYNFLMIYEMSIILQLNLLLFILEHLILF